MRAAASASTKVIGTGHAATALTLGEWLGSNVMHDEEGRAVKTPIEARAGFLDRPVLVVLCLSLALGVVVLAVLWLGFFTPNA